jgi:glycerophosphoryl diester phosphodiesterase
MLALTQRPRIAVAVLACLLSGAPAVLVAQTTTPAAGKPATAKPATAKKKKAATPAKKAAVTPKPVVPSPPAPPPVVELIGHLVMPPDALRPGPPSGQFDGEGRRAAAPRFDAQPVQGVSSIKPGPTQGAWWGLSDNGFGRKWNSPDYQLCIYLFDVRPRTQAGPDSRTALQAVIDLSDPARFFPWRLADEGSPERILTGADADPESLVAMADDTFWVGDELGPWLLHFSVDGDLLGPPVELPDGVRSPEHPLVLAGADTARLERSRGIEAMDLAGDNRTLVVLLEGTVKGDAPKTLRLLRYDTQAGKWLPGTHIYELDADTMSVTDLSRIEANRFVVIERDDQEGDAAKAKRVYSIDLDKAPSDRTPTGKPLAKKLVVDLLAIGNSRGLIESLPVGAPFRFPYLTPESIQVLDRRHVVVVNDNNYPDTGGRGLGVKDATEWLWLELASPL